MSKYIIEIDDDLTFDVQFLQAIGAEPNGVVRIRHIEFEKLEELNSDYINEHFGDLQDTAYKRGFEDGKGAINKGCEGCKYQANRELTCPCSECANNFKNHWMAKKQDDEIKVGDEVKHDRGWGAVVTQIDELGLSCVDKFGAVASYSDISRFSKTGRHFDIESILEDMRE